MGMRELPQPPRELALAAPDPRLRGQGLEGAVGNARGLPQLRHLVLVLDRPHSVDDAVRRNKLELPGRKTLVLEIRQDVGLELHLSRKTFAEIDHHRALGRHDLDVGHLLGRLGVTEVGIERCFALRPHEHSGVRAVEAGEIQNVGQVRDQERRIECCRQRFEPRHSATLPARYSSASR
jgi:hypothetical protein